MHATVDGAVDERAQPGLVDAAVRCKGGGKGDENTAE